MQPFPIAPFERRWNRNPESEWCGCCTETDCEEENWRDWNMCLPQQHCSGKAPDWIHAGYCSLGIATENSGVGWNASASFFTASLLSSCINCWELFSFLWLTACISSHTAGETVRERAQHQSSILSHKKASAWCASAVRGCCNGA